VSNAHLKIFLSSYRRSLGKIELFITRAIGMDKTLYEKDYYLWIEKTVSLLENHRFSDLDLENLIEEVRDMGKSQQHSLESYLSHLIEHLLKIKYWESEKAYNVNHWKGEITNFRFRLSKLLKVSPSLRPYLESIFEEYYLAALRSLCRRMGVKIGTLPTESIFTLEQALDDNWFPDVEN
jgi:hypothetical protein